MNKKTLSYATGLALATALISGFSNFISKIAVTAVKDPVIFTTLKNTLVALFLIAALVGYKKWQEISTLNKKQIYKLLAVGVIGGSIPFALFFTGLTQTSAINASLIHKTLFIWVLLLAIPFLKEHVTKLQLLGIGAIFAANLVVGGFTGFKFNAGELMILGATILWAVENIIAKKVLDGVSSSIVAAARMGIGSIVLLVFLFARGSGPAVLGLNLNAAQWGWVLLTSVLLFGYVTTWYAALKRAPATYVATLLVPATFVTNVLSAVFITHAFGVTDLISGFLFAAGTFFVIYFAKRSSESFSKTLINTNIITDLH